MPNNMVVAFILLLSSFPSQHFSDEHKGGKNLLPVSNELYKKSCGACHFAYQPGLLPERSWKKMMDSPGHILAVISHLMAVQRKRSENIWSKTARKTALQKGQERFLLQ